MKKTILFIPLTLILSLTLIQAQTLRTGLDFDGSDDIVRVPHYSGLDLGTGEFTIEAWIQADADQGVAINPTIAIKKDTTVNANGFAMGLSNSGRLAIELAGVAYTTGFGMSQIDLRDGQCHHVAWTRDASGASDTIRAYIDGVLQRRSVRGIPSTDISYPSEDLYMGSVRGGFGTQDLTFKGMIKEVRIWNVARSESELANNSDKFAKNNPSGLVGNWRLYENSGQTFENFVASGNDGTLGLTANAESGDPSWMDFCDVINDVLPPPTTTGIEENFSSAKQYFYPNPVKDMVTLDESIRGQIDELRLFSALGKLIRFERNVQGATLDLADLDSGIYFAEFQLTNGERLQNKFIKE